MTEFALTKENSATIGFVVSCIFAGAIDKRELQAWADYVLVSTDSYPLYIVDLATGVQGRPLKVPSPERRT